MRRFTASDFAALRDVSHTLGSSHSALQKRIRLRLDDEASSLDGGPGSGNWGHAGRKGQIGGSMPGGGAKNRMETVKGGYVSTTSFGKAKSGRFSKAVKNAKETVDPRKAWRVTAHTKKELDEEYPGAKLHVTKGGSTCAVTTSGDIISVCRKKGDALIGKDLLKLAVLNGGTKLDSYSGNHEFYTENGFEPVSWCKWNQEYAPDDWVEGLDKPEPIIFYKYTGKVSTETAKEFLARVAASEDYGAAQAVRDGQLEG